MAEIRIGSGYDTHPLVPGRPLVLGGVAIPFHEGLDGHSDADALTHAVCDALLGAAAMGDIGRHFPDSDPAYKDISSLLLLKQTGQMLNDKGFRIINIDATVTTAQPKLAGFIDEMRRNLGNALTLNPDRVSVKAKSGNNLGVAGRGEGVTAQAAALIEQGNDG
jgi:2-C-methyl-D-erythritol 2,4-cyclodiphosphate synthase